MLPKSKTIKKSKAQSRPSDPYQTLGVPPGARWEQIQAAYKENIKKYHPDKVSHLGEEFTTLANEKFLRIQAAYNTLKTQREHKKP